MISRRGLLGSSALLPLGACASVEQFVDSSLSTVINDVKTLASGLPAILPYLSSLGVSSGITSVVNTALTGIENAATAVQNVGSTLAAQPFIQQIVGYLNALTPVVAAIPGLPAIVATIMAAGSVLLTAIENVVSPTVAASTVRTSMPMSVGQARGILKGVATS
jgi:hypothetical protein